MKRWLVASLALNLALIGGGFGYFGASSLPFPPPLPDGGPGFQSMVVAVVKTFPAERRDGALQIIDAVRSSYPQLHRPSAMNPQKVGGLLDQFVDAKLPPKMPILEQIKQRQALEIQETHEIFYRLQTYMTPQERQLVVDAGRQKMVKLRALMKQDGMKTK